MASFQPHLGFLVSVYRTPWKQALNTSCLTACLLPVYVNACICLHSASFGTQQPWLCREHNLLKSTYWCCLPAKHPSLYQARPLCVHILLFKELWIFLLRWNQCLGVDLQFSLAAEVWLLGSSVAVLSPRLLGSVAEGCLGCAPVWLGFHFV